MTTVVIGIGNALRGDDGAGIAVAERLGGLACDQEPSRMIDAWEGADAAILVDTVVSGAPPGTIHYFNASEAPIPAHTLRSSTHAIGLAETIELARALGRLPAHVVVYGIEGAGFAAGAPLTPEVEAAVCRLATAIEEELCTSAP